MEDATIDRIIDTYHRYEADPASNHKRDFTDTNYGYKIVRSDETSRAILTLNNDVFIDGLEEYYAKYNIPRLDYNFPSQLKNDLYQLYHHFYSLIRRVLMLISRHHFGDVNRLQHYISKENFVMVINYYFALTQGADGGVVCKRFDDHYDFSLISIILNDDYRNDEYNFEYQEGDEWKQLENHDSRFVLFYGMLLEILTGGDFKALKHRVLVNGKNRNRFMVGFFAQPDEDKILEIGDRDAHLLEGYNYDDFNKQTTYNRFMRQTMCSQLLGMKSK
jgi:isopenicillin N synthase-like dioxygenase